jgi:hypothetical protein
MPAIRRLRDAPYRWDIMAAPLAEVANQAKLLPPAFISVDGFGITDAACRYLAPLMVGEAYPPFKNWEPEIPQRGGVTPSSTHRGEGCQCAQPPASGTLMVPRMTSTHRPPT